MKKKLALYVDVALLSGWTLVGLLNMLFFITHANPAILSGLFVGKASPSFTFMAASAVVMLSVSAVAIRGALLRRRALCSFRASAPWRVARAALTAFACFFVAVTALIIASSFPSAAPQTGDLLILGAHVSDDGLSDILSGRLETGAGYAAARPDMRIIVSGGKGLDEPVSEAEAMSDFLVSHGIAADRIILEDQSHNTYENLVNTAALLRTGCDKYEITIVTSEFHICRTAMLASRAGYAPYFVAAKTPPSILPSCYSREFFGLIKSFFIDR